MPVSWNIFYKPKYYNASGVISTPNKVWAAEVTPNTGNGFSIDISSAGFSSITSVEIVAVKNTATATSVPKVAIKSKSTSAIVVNVIEGNATLSLGVLLGVSEQFANISGVTLMVRVEGN